MPRPSRKTTAPTRTVRIRPEIYPCTRLEIEDLELVDQVSINHNGGMGGGHRLTFGTLSRTPDEAGFLTLTHRVSPSPTLSHPVWISEVRPGRYRLWRISNHHTNPNFAPETVRVIYLLTDPSVTLEPFAPAAAGSREVEDGVPIEKAGRGRLSPR